MTINDRPSLIGLWLDDYQKLLTEWGEAPYRAKQLASWVYDHAATDFSQMTNFPKTLRDRLAEKFTLNRLKLIRKEESPSDKSIKFLFGLEDGETIEAVLIKDKGKNTLCLSSQVGCALGCLFCATGYMGYKRNLTAGEIISQVLTAKSYINSGEILNNVVYMGMGEPLLNYENMVKSLRILSSDFGLTLSPKRITVSTAGIVPQIHRLAQEGMKVRLAISLHAPDEALRKKLMPISNKYSLKELLDAARLYALQLGSRITFEYILIHNVNDSDRQAKELAKLISGIPCKVNLILYNPIPDAPFERPTLEQAQKFREILYPRTQAVTLRISKGRDIMAACGQLKTKVYKKQKTVDFSRIIIPDGIPR